MANNVAAILKRKTKKIISISPEDTTLQALQKMADNNIGSLVVMKDEQYVGIISERDYSRKVVLMGKHSHETPVAEIMNTDSPIVSPQHSIEDCLDIITKTHARYLPVLENGHVAGIISIVDLVHETSLMYKESADQLRSYITSA